MSVKPVNSSTLMYVGSFLSLCTLAIFVCTAQSCVWLRNGGDVENTPLVLQCCATVLVVLVVSFKFQGI